MLSFILNEDIQHTEMPPGMTMLDFVRYHKHLTGTKIGCREGDCGACTILVGECIDDDVVYRSMTSCLMPLTNAHGKHIVTIEGINPAHGLLTPVQETIVEENGTQCGFCTIGFVMSLTGFCLQQKEVTFEGAKSAIDGNICRCTGYKSIERACSRLVNLLNEQSSLSPLSFAIAQGVVPAWWGDIKKRLGEIHRTTEEAVSKSTLQKKIAFVGGGTDLYVQRPEEMVNISAVHLFDTLAMKDIREVNGRIEIGGSVTVTDLMESSVMQDLFPRLIKHLKLVSSTPIRNMATIAGNLVNASPIGDLTIWLLAMDSTVVVRNVETREIPLRNFYLGYKVIAKTADEVVEKICFNKPDHSSIFNFEKVSKRTYLDIATVNTAIFLRIEDNIIVEAHVSAGGVAPVPLYLKNTSYGLLQKSLPLDDEALLEINHILQSEISPISDVRGSSRYKRLLLQQLFLAHFIELFQPA